MKHIGKILLLALLLASTDSFSQWGWQQLPINPSKTIAALNFLNDDLGYAMMVETPSGAKTLEKTTDGGGTWNVVTLPGTAGPEFQDFDFHADGMGVALFRNIPNTVTPTSIYQTSNDGVTWQDITPDTTATGLGTAACQFLDQDTGFFATDQYFYSTVDAGVNWTTQMIPGFAMAIDFIDGHHGTVGLFDGTFNYFGGVMTTTDGGASWNTLNLTENGTVIGEVGQLTTTISIAAPVKFGSYGYLKFFKTSNNGVTWDTISLPSPAPNAAFTDIHFNDAMNGVVCILTNTANHLFNTTNGGTNWIFQDSIPQFINSDLELVGNTGYLSGETGTLYKLTLGMAVEASTISPFSIYPNPVGSGQNIHWNASESFKSLSIMDITGKEVHHSTLDQNAIVLPNLVAGMYLLRFEGDNNSKSIKLIIE